MTATPQFHIVLGNCPQILIGMALETNQPPIQFCRPSTPFMAQTQPNDIDSPSWTMSAVAPQRVAQEHPKECDKEMRVPILP